MYPNRVALSNDKGHTSIVNIARAKVIGTLQVLVISPLPSSRQDNPFLPTRY